jgi:xanthine dehydrogenase small subunit
MDRNIVVSAVVAYAGLADIPRRAPHCEKALCGQELTESTIESAGQSLAEDFATISDVRSSASYRLETAKNLLRRLQFELPSPSGPGRISVYAWE